MTLAFIVFGSIVLFALICTLFFLYEQAVKELNIELIKNQHLAKENKKLKAIIGEYHKTMASYEIATEEDVSGLRFGEF